MGGGDGEGAGGLVMELGRDLLQVARFEQDALGDLDDLLARFGDADEALARAHEDLHAQLILELEDLLAHAGLRREQHLRGLRQIEVVAGDF
ncbi:MAG: hypothetical protein AN481_19875, partial [Aphanizomenon flos-aquae LD13]